ncbi:MAG: AAA family ATPase [Magnetococcales bacterium]|nr:AAA family ATPase [Magnetococcales bacterium]
MSKSRRDRYVAGAESYLDVLGLTSSPFPVVPDAANLFETQWMTETIAEIVDGVVRRKGFIAVTGEVGLGKTTLSRSLLTLFQALDIRVSLTFNSFLQGVELIRAINQDFNLPAEGQTLSELMAELTHFLMDAFRHNHNCVILIDDAQNLTPDNLEMIRQISNLETGTEKLVQIILVGQTELETTLHHHSMRQLHSRLAMHKRIQPLTGEELSRYVHYKLERAGNQKRLSITRGALAVLYKQSGGNPRKASRMMDRCLYALVAFQRFEINARLIKLVAAELNAELNQKGESKLSVQKSAGYWLGLPLLALLVILMSVNRAPLSQLVAGFSSFIPSVAHFLAEPSRPLSGGHDQDSLPLSFLEEYGLASYVTPFKRALEQGEFASISALIEAETGFKMVQLSTIPPPLEGKFSTLKMQKSGGQRSILFWKPAYSADDLHLLSNGETVRRVKADLSRFGLDTGPELAWGNSGILHTLAIFQKSAGLPATGRLDDTTLFLLDQLKNRAEESGIKK